MLNFENLSGEGPPAHLGAIPYPQITVTAFTNNLKVYLHKSGYEKNCQALQRLIYPQLCTALCSASPVHLGATELSQPN